MHHLRLDVERLSALGMARPPVEHLAGGLDHRRSECVDPIGSEGRLRDAAGVGPPFALGGDEPLADDRLELVRDELRTRIVGDVVPEHTLHVVGVDEQVDRERAPEVDDVAVLEPGVHERLHVVPLDLPDAPEDRVPARSGYRPARRGHRGRLRRHRWLPPGTACISAGSIGLNPCATLSA